MSPRSMIRPTEETQPPHSVMIGNADSWFNSGVEVLQTSSTPQPCRTASSSIQQGRMSCKAPNCFDPGAEYDWELDPDISGIGVLVGFVATAYITSALLLFRYVKSLPLDSSSIDLVGTLDQRVLSWKREKAPSRPPKWVSATRSCVLLMSDQQLVTGVAILASGYSQLKCGMSMDNWKILVDLAWFSSVTHLAALTFIRAYIQDHASVLHLRLPLMFALVTMLFAALFPTGNARCFAMAVPTACCFDMRLGSEEDVSRVMRLLGEDAIAKVLGPMAFSQALLVLMFVSQVIKSYRLSSDFTRKWLLERPGKYWKDKTKMLGRRAYFSASFQQKWLLLFNVVSLSVLITIKAIVSLTSSMFWDLLWLFIALIWGTLRLTFDRIDMDKSRDSPNSSAASGDNSWSFGQMVPVLLLLMPIMHTIEIYLDSRKPTEENKKDSQAFCKEIHEDIPGDTQDDKLKRSSDLSTTVFTNSLSLPEPSGGHTPKSTGLNAVTSLYEETLYQEPWFQDTIIIALVMFLVNAGVFLSQGVGSLAVERFVWLVSSPTFWLQSTCLGLFPLFYSIGRLRPCLLSSDPCRRLVNFVLGQRLKHRVFRLAYSACILCPTWVNLPSDPIIPEVAVLVALGILLYLPMAVLCVWAMARSSTLMS